MDTGETTDSTVMTSYYDNEIERRYLPTDSESCEYLLNGIININTL